MPVISIWQQSFLSRNVSFLILTGAPLLPVVIICQAWNGPWKPETEKVTGLLLSDMPILFPLPSHFSYDCTTENNISVRVRQLMLSWSTTPSLSLMIRFSLLYSNTFSRFKWTNFFTFICLLDMKIKWINRLTGRHIINQLFSIHPKTDSVKPEILMV